MDRPTATRINLNPAQMRRIRGAGFTPGSCNLAEWLVTQAVGSPLTVVNEPKEDFSFADPSGNRAPLPWRIVEIERYESTDSGEPAYAVLDAEGRRVMDDQTYYPTAPSRIVAERIVAAMNVWVNP